MKTSNKTTLGQAFLLSFFAIALAHGQTDKNDEQEVKKDDNRPPIGCREVGYQFVLEALHLKTGSNGDNQSMYLLHNQLGQPINLFQMRNEESSRSIYLNHVIGAHEWGILSTNERQVKFICTTPAKKSLYGQVVDCATSLKVCEYTNVRYGLNNRGNYWLINSSTRNGAVSAVVHYGIIPGN